MGVPYGSKIDSINTCAIAPVCNAVYCHILNSLGKFHIFSGGSGEMDQWSTLVKRFSFFLSLSSNKFIVLFQDTQRKHTIIITTLQNLHTPKKPRTSLLPAAIWRYLAKKRICLSIRRCHSNYSYKLWTDNTARHGKMKAWDIKNKSRHVKQDIRHWTANLRMEKLHLSCCRTLPMQILSPNWKHCNWILTQFACLDKSDELSTLEKSLK